MRKKDYIYNIGDVVNGVEILEKTYVYWKKGRIKSYMCKCLKCGYIQNKAEPNLLVGKRCVVCSGQLIVKNINSIWKTHPHLRKYFVNIDDSYNNTSNNTTKKILFKCPDCGFEKEMFLKNISKRGFSCSVCGDGVSYGEKLISNLLQFNNIDFIPQKTFDWSNSKRYDFYVPKFNCIVEAHGSQHYKETRSKWDNLKSQQNNDEYKRTIAINNGIEHYIVIDCFDSNFNYIKDSVLNSELLYLLKIDPSKINWTHIHNQAGISLSKKILDEYINVTQNVQQISKNLGLCVPTVKKYLEIWNDLGLCEYKDKFKNRWVYCVNIDMYFKTCPIASKYILEHEGIYISNKTINSICRGMQEISKGYTFKYVYK